MGDPRLGTAPGNGPDALQRREKGAGADVPRHAAPHPILHTAVKLT
jgi:hypothetical protein